MSRLLSQLPISNFSQSIHPDPCHADPSNQPANLSIRPSGSADQSQALLRPLTQPSLSIQVSNAPTRTLIAGVDLALKANVVACILDDETQLGKPKTFPNSLPGATALSSYLIQLAQTYQCSHIKVGMEATSVYWFHLHQFLTEDTTLKPFNARVFTFNPKLIAKFKQGYADTDKTDAIDALVIAYRTRMGKLPNSHLIDEQFEPLKRLTRYRYQLIRSMVRQQNVFLNHLFFKYSAWQQIKPFSSNFGTTAQTFIQEEDPESLTQMDLAEMTKKISAISRNRVVDPDKTAQLIKQVAAQSYQLTTNQKEPIDLILLNSYDTIKFFKRKIKDLDKVIAKEVQRYTNPLLSVKGIALVCAAGITAELGSVSRFDSESAAAKYAGLVWSKRSSGEFTAQNTPRKKTGNAYLRYYLVQAANSLRVHNDLYKAYYQKKYDEVPKYQHQRALVLSARKLIRLCFAMLRDHSLYSAEKHRKDS